jgi:hypothetical protein
VERSTVIALLVVVGLGGLAWWWFARQTTTGTGAQTVPGCGSGVMGSIGNFIQGHVDRKNALAPTIAGKYTGLSAGTVKPITDIAGQLSPSGYVEKFIGDKVGGFFCNAKLPGWGEITKGIGDYGVGFQKESVEFGTTNLAAGTIGPVKSLYSAGGNLVNGNFGAAGKDVVNSVINGPKAAYETTKDLAKAIIPGW